MLKCQKLWGDVGLEDADRLYLMQKVQNSIFKLLKVILISEYSKNIHSSQYKWVILLPHVAVSVAVVLLQHRFASACRFTAGLWSPPCSQQQMTLSTFSGWFRPVRGAGGVSVCQTPRSLWERLTCNNTKTKKGVNAEKLPGWTRILLFHHQTAFYGKGRAATRHLRQR